MADLLKYKLTDQTTAGVPVDTSILSSIASDQTAESLNPKLHNFYMTTLPLVTDANNKKIYDNVLSVVNRNAGTQRRIRDLASDIVKSIGAIDAKEGHNQGASKDGTTQAATDNLETKLNRMLNGNKDPKVTPVFSKITAGGANKFKEFQNKYATNGSDDAAKELRAYYSDPVVSPDNENITATDRIVFIAMTFIIRGLSLYLVEWAVNTYMVKSFQSAFTMYLLCYLTMFTLWAIMVNKSNSLFLKMLFYYINTDPHGFGRIAVHFAVQLIIIPIPLIVKTKGYEYTEEEYTFEKRRKTMSILNNFTFFLWAITSVIAIRY